MKTEEQIFAIGAMRVTEEDGETISMAPGYLPDLYMQYFHEAGHVLGNQMSFRLGILTPEEVEKSAISIPFAMKFRFWKKTVKSMFKPMPFDEEDKKIADMILAKITNGKWRPTCVIFRSRTSKEMYDIFIRYGGNPNIADTSDEELDSKAAFRLSFTKKGRNGEIPSHYIEFLCMKIFNNTFGMSRDQNQDFPRERVDSHYRANKVISNILVRRQKYGPKWTVPSLVDIKQSRGE